MDRTGSGSCERQVLVLGLLELCVLLPEIKLVDDMSLMETGCEDGRWMELAQDRDQWQALVLGLLELCVLLPDIKLVGDMVIWILWKQVVRMGGGWSWLRIVCKGRL